MAVMARKPAVIRPSKQLEESLREALLSEIDSALAECDRLASWEQPERREAVHELRRALKRFRAGASPRSSVPNAARLISCGRL
ncbi:MAG: hypothetical protein ACKOGJ_09210 [Phycisphaerales bacterium]